MKRLTTLAVLLATAAPAFAAGPATGPSAAPGAVRIRFRPDPNLSGGRSTVEARGEDVVSCVIQLDSDTSRGGDRADAQTAQALLNTTAVQDAAVERMLAKNPDVRGRFTISTSSANYRMIRLEVFPEAGDATAARAMQAALIETLQDALNASNQAAVAAFADRRKQLESDIAKAQEELAAVGKKLGHTPRRVPDGPYQLQSLQQELQQVTFDLTAKRARLDAIKQRVKGATTQPAPAAPATPDAAAQPTAATPPVPPVPASFNRRGGTAFPASPTGRIEDEVPQLEVGIVEAEARRKAIAEQIAKYMASKTPVELGDPNEASRLMNEENRLRNEISNLQGQLDNLKRSVPVATVKLTVLDGRRPATQE